jgi:hypothetical protein
MKSFFAMLSVLLAGAASARYISQSDHREELGDAAVDINDKVRQRLSPRRPRRTTSAYPFGFEIYSRVGWGRAEKAADGATADGATADGAVPSPPRADGATVDGAVPSPPREDGAVPSPPRADGAVPSPPRADGAGTSPAREDGAATSPAREDGAGTSPARKDGKDQNGKDTPGG